MLCWDLAFNFTFPIHPTLLSLISANRHFTALISTRKIRQGLRSTDLQKRPSGDSIPSIVNAMCPWVSFPFMLSFLATLTFFYPSNLLETHRNFRYSQTRRHFWPKQLPPESLSFCYFYSVWNYYLRPTTSVSQTRETAERPPIWIPTKSFHRRSTGSPLSFLVSRTRQPRRNTHGLARYLQRLRPILPRKQKRPRSGSLQLLHSRHHAFLVSKPSQSELMRSYLHKYQFPKVPHLHPLFFIYYRTSVE